MESSMAWGGVVDGLAWNEGKTRGDGEIGGE